MKMNDELAKHGLYFDYLYNLRVLDPDIASETSDLKEKSGDYTESKGDHTNLANRYSG